MTARLVVFIFFAGFGVLLLTFNSYKKLPVETGKIDLAQLEADQAKAIAAEAKRVEALKQAALAKKKKVEVVEKDYSVELSTPELKSGHAVYFKKGKCLTCHGKNGEGKKSQKAPMIGGQHAWYLEKQITDMKNKVRVNKKMYPFVKNLTAKEIKDVSLYLSKIPI